METPTKMPEQETIQETFEESQRPLEIVPTMVPKSISEVIEENQVKSLWEEVCKANETTKNK